MLLEAALLEVRWEDHLAQRAALVNAVGPGERNGEDEDVWNRVDINIFTLFCYCQSRTSMMFCVWNKEDINTSIHKQKPMMTSLMEVGDTKEKNLVRTLIFSVTACGVILFLLHVFKWNTSSHLCVGQQIPGVEAEAAPGFTSSAGLMVTGWLSSSVSSLANTPQTHIKGWKMIYSLAELHADTHKSLKDFTKAGENQLKVGRSGWVGTCYVSI